LRQRHQRFLQTSCLRASIDFACCTLIIHRIEDCILHLQGGAFSYRPALIGLLTFIIRTTKIFHGSRSWLLLFEATLSIGQFNFKIIHRFAWLVAVNQHFILHLSGTTSIRVPQNPMLSFTVIIPSYRWISDLVAVDLLLLRVSRLDWRLTKSTKSHG
jgi:hypothetical protein